MSIVRKLKDKINRKAREIKVLEYDRNEIDSKLRDANVTLKAFEEALSLHPNDEVKQPKVPRLGSIADAVTRAIQMTGEPLTLNQLLVALDKPLDKKNKASLAGQLNSYVRDGDYFTRPAPNTFGVIGMNKVQPDAANDDEFIQEPIVVGRGFKLKL